MIVVRDVLQAKYGEGGELVALFKESRTWSGGYAKRILTDASGPFFTVVVETEVDSLADWERFASHFFSRPEFKDFFARMQPLIESGRREFYHVE